MTSSRGKGGEDLAPPVPPNNVLPNIIHPPERLPIVRPGFGREGRRILLLTNHFRVRYSTHNTVFHHYTVSIETDNKYVVTNKETGRKVMEKLHKTYCSELAGKTFAYDGERSLFTVGELPQKNFEFTVIMEESSARVHSGSPDDVSTDRNDRKRSKHLHTTKTFKVEIHYTAKIPFNSIAQALEGGEGHPEDALRVLDIILRQQQAKRGCLLVRQSFFNADHMNLVDVGGGVSGCRGFHSSFRTTQDGLSLNMDVSTTMILTPGPVVDFLLANQNVRDPRDIDWAKAKRMLKNMRIKAQYKNQEFKIIGLSELPCKRQLFPMKVRDNGEEEHVVDVSVFDYFKSRKIDITWSACLPCLNVGKPKRPNYLPLEFCHLVPLQRYTKALSSKQRAALVEKSRQKPLERIRVVTDMVKNNRYDRDPMLASCGILIEDQLMQLDGRVLPAPTLKVGNSEDCFPRNGRWNFNQKRLLIPAKIDDWAIVNFSSRCDLSYLSRELINCGRNKGMHINRPSAFFEEDRQWMRSGPVARVEHMMEKIKAKFSSPPQFLLCVLPERKNSELYGPWKKKNLHELGIPTQCVSPVKINDQYLTNVLLKINTKLDGINSLLALEHTRSIPFIKDEPTMILGMDVSHGSPGQSVPSIAAVVGSRHWPLVSRYRASVRTQAPKVEMIDALYKPQANGEDDGMIRELLLDFYQSSGGRKPFRMIIFRDGVSESQFNQVLNVELNQIIKAFEHLGETKLPKFTIIIAQKIHHTKLFQAGSPDNVPPGTVVDRTVVHPRNYDFYMCAQAGMIGTSRPTHYQVLLDEIGFSPDDLQKLVHSLSYAYQRSTTAVSVVAPVCYAHLAALQMSQFIKFEDHSETSSGQTAVPEMPRLDPKVCSSMFFC